MRNHRFLANSHRVTEIFSLRSQGHGGFWQVTNCDPGRSRDYCVYVSDHPLRMAEKKATGEVQRGAASLTKGKGVTY